MLQRNCEEMRELKEKLLQSPQKTSKERFIRAFLPWRAKLAAAARVYQRR